MRMAKSVSINKNQYIQALRGISIAAVVLIHCLSKDGVGSWLIKPWLYFSVMLFVFLSGYLTKKERVDGQIWKFYLKRLSKIIPPYIVWTIIYFLYDKNTSITYFIKLLITGKACGPLYFLIDYGQLVVLTPLLFLLLKKRWGRVILYSITPAWMIFNYFAQWKNWDTFVPLCLWLLTPYLLGLEHEKWEEKIKKIPFSASLAFTLIAGIIETAEGLIWRHIGIEGLMNTQVKLSTLLYFFAVVVFLFRLSDVQKEKISNITFLTMLGEWSFGIYLNHKLFIYLISNFIPLGFPSGLLLWLLAGVASALTVAVANKILPKKLNSLIGFV